MVLINSVQAIFDPNVESDAIEDFRRQNPEWIEDCTTTSVSFILTRTTYHELTHGALKGE